MPKRKFFYWLTISNFLYIIVLLILAGVTIATLTGENGILMRASEAKEKTLQGQVKEEIELMSTDYTGGKYTGGEQDIKKYYQGQAAKGEISSIKDNGDGTYTISKDGYEVKIDEESSVIDIQEKEEVAVTDVWYKIDETTLHFSNSDLGGYSKHDDSLEVPEWLEGATNFVPSPITKVIFENTVSPISTAQWFQWCENLSEIENINYLNTSNVVSMKGMFHACHSLQYIDVSGFDTSNVTTMYAMFAYCSSLKNVDVSGFDTSNVTSFGDMFSFCNELTVIDVTGFNTNNISGEFAIEGMFHQCESLENIDVSNFNTKNATRMDNMFRGCSKITNIDISNFDTSNVTNIGNMFQNCSSLTNLDLSNFNTSKVTRMAYMFYGCTSLEELNLKNFDTRKVTTAIKKQYMFTNVTCPVYVGENWNLLESDTGYTGTFSK